MRIQIKYLMDSGQQVTCTEPFKQEIKDILDDCLKELGVEIAGKQEDVRRWSATDLATDLAPLLVERLGG